MTRAEIVRQALDLMREATEEFIADDGLQADAERVHDLSALLRVRDLYDVAFAGADEVAEVVDLDGEDAHALLIVDGGLWSDPAAFGPYASEEDARRGLAERPEVADFDDAPDADAVGLILRLGDPRG